MDFSQHSVDVFSHTRVVMGMVIGLGITRTLLTFANLIQMPNTHQRSLLHQLWLGSMLIELCLFWYGHIELALMPHWTFLIFSFYVGYAVVLYFLTALLTSEKAHEYGGYEDFFIQRRHWFFGFLATTMLLDVVDSTILNQQPGIDWGDFIPAIIFLPLCIWGWITKNKTVQLTIVGFHITYLVITVLLYSFDQI